MFPDLRTLLARTTPFRSGDALAGLAADSAALEFAACLERMGLDGTARPERIRAALIGMA